MEAPVSFRRDDDLFLLHFIFNKRYCEKNICAMYSLNAADLVITAKCLTSEVVAIHVVYVNRPAKDGLLHFWYDI